MAKKAYQTGTETKERILDVSKRLFYEKGFADTLYDDICRIAQVNRALIPYHFKNKADLALAAYDSFIDAYVQTRNEIAQGYPDEIRLIIGILYFYRLLEDPKVARFVDYIVGENTYRERLLLGESIMYRNLMPQEKRLPARQWDAIIHLIWGMEVETIRMIARGQYDDITQIGKIMIQMVFQYFGYEKAKVAQMYGRANRILNRYQYTVMPDFTIVATTN